MESTLKMAGDNTSNQSQTGTTQSTTGQTPSTHSLKSADGELRHYVEEMLHLDKRFIGMSSYVININFYWSTEIPTACAGHGFIFFNPEFWDKLNEEKKKTVVAHEIWHLILNHLDRMEGLDSDIHNQAADHVINNGLLEDGFEIGPDEDFGGIKPCCDPRFKNMSTEQVYRIIQQEKKDDPDSHGGGEGASGPTKDQIEDLIQEAINGSGKDLQQVADENEEAREQAVGQPKDLGGTGVGSEAGNLVREIIATCVRMVKDASYEEIFEKYLIDPLSGGKRTFMRPSRRQAKGGLRLKGKFPKKGKTNRLTRLVYALDVSGSISQNDARIFLESAKTLKERLNPREMIIMLWDTRIVFEKTFGEHDNIGHINIRAGGGTSLEPVYKRVKQINPEALVIFTDLCVGIPPKPEWETIWFVPDRNVHPYHLNQVTYGDVYAIPEK